MSLYFESHVTIEPVLTDDPKRGLINTLTRSQGFKIAELILMTKTREESREDTFCTSRSRELSDVTDRTKQLVTQLKAFGFKVYRYKIEEALIDSKIEDAWSAL